MGRLKSVYVTSFAFSEGIPWNFDSDGMEGAEAKRPVLESLSRTLMATLFLASQEITTEERQEVDRGARRRLERLGALPRPVRMMTLRRAQRPGRPETQSSEAARVYHHQWVVRGHWRNHWFPSRQDHKPLWIAPHLAGPEDAPLLGAERVNVLRR